MEKTWNKFHSIFGSDLKITLETTFPKEVALKLDPLYEKSGLVHESNEPVKRVYEPALQVLGSCLDGEAAQVFFEPVSSDNSLFRRLVFARKINHSTQKPRRWMVAGRHGELIHFGFDSWNSRNVRYLSLAYPSRGQFNPVYFKIQGKGGDSFVFLEVWAWDQDKQTVVQARRVSEKEAPGSLHSAKP